MASAQVYEIAFRLAGIVDGSMKSAFAKANGGLEQMGSKSKAAAGTMKALGTAAVATGAAIGAVAVGLSGAAKNADAFNGAMKQVQASTNMSTREIAQLKKMSTNLYNANLGEDWNDLADAISKTRSVTKLSGKELEMATANALVYRDVFGEDVSQSIKAADTMMRNFGISNTEAFNLLAQGAQNGLNKTDELLDTANEYAPYFKTLGFSADQMFNIFSAGLENGAFSLDKTADAVKEFNIRSKDGSKASAEAYRALGLDAEKMSQIFAKGGPTAQKSFQEVVNAIAKVKDPVKQNAIAVGLFGTQAEDLEMDVLTAMGSARKQFDMTKNTMESVSKIKYDTISDAFQGIARQVETGLIIPIGSKALPHLTKLSGYLKDQMPAIQKRMANLGKTIGNFTAPLRAAKDMLSGDFVSGRKIMMDVGFDHKQIDMFKDRVIMIRDYLSGVSSIFLDLGAKATPVLTKIGDIASSVFSSIYQFWSENGPQIVALATGIFGFVGSAIGGAFNVVKNLLSIVQPMVPIIMKSVTGFASKILSFWQTDGAQILKAVQNIFGGIVKVIQFLAPVVLPILKMLWSTISGLVNGALNVIMGAVRLFTGIFTGDFSKMWQGVKQIFFGAVEFVWNYMNLMFVGRIITGIKMLGTRVVASVFSMGRNIKMYFKDMWAYGINIFQTGKTFGVNTFNALKDAVVGTASRMASGIREKFGLMKNRALSIVGEMKTSISSRFNEIIDMAKALPGKMGQGIQNMAGKAVEGAVTVGNKLLSKIGGSVNGVIGGLNWVGGKLGIKTTIPTWAVPQYANGTKGHPGGPAILGDGRGANAGPEMYRTPDGRLGLSPARDTLMNLPKGTEVLSATVTRAILANQVPRYAFGTMVGKVTDAFNTGMSWIGDKAGQAKDAAFDVFSYLSNPTELLATMLEKFGIEVPKIDGALGNLAAGAFSSVKDHALSYIKGLVPKMSESLGASFSGSGSTMAKTAISQALAMLNKPMSLLGPLMTIAQKESGFNPNAINDWDINAQRGDPSVGLFQIINSTFQRWKMPGYNNRRNPLDSALAAIRYMDGRYGGIMNHPGIVNMMRGGGYLPYANGGIITRPHMGLVGEAGPEAIIPLSGDKRGVATNLLRRVASAFGMEVGEKRGGMRGIIDYVSSKTNASSASSSEGIQFVYSPVINLGGDVSRSEMDDALKMSYEDFTVMMERFMRDRQRKAF